jgi:hypothetical protein
MSVRESGGAKESRKYPLEVIEVCFTLSNSLSCNKTKSCTCSGAFEYLNSQSLRGAFAV